jgi:hypothetical protein
MMAGRRGAGVQARGRGLELGAGPEGWAGAGPEGWAGAGPEGWAGAGPEGWVGAGPEGWAGAGRDYRARGGGTKALPDASVRSSAMRRRRRSDRNGPMT